MIVFTNSLHAINFTKNQIKGCFFFLNVPHAFSRNVNKHLENAWCSPNYNQAKTMRIPCVYPNACGTFGRLVQVFINWLLNKISMKFSVSKYFSNIMKLNNNIIVIRLHNINTILNKHNIIKKCNNNKNNNT